MYSEAYAKRIIGILHLGLLDLLACVEDLYRDLSLYDDDDERTNRISVAVSSVVSVIKTTVQCARGRD